jgi:hypothetical protein
MATILIRNAAVLGTMQGRRELAGCAVVVQDGVIAAVGVETARGRAQRGDRRLRCVVTPLLVNSKLKALLRNAAEPSIDGPLYNHRQAAQPLFTSRNARTTSRPQD